MMRSVAAVILTVLGLGCGGPSQPLLANAPRPNPAVVAGAAAAVAGAATLADPGYAAKNAESNKPSEEKKPQKSGGVVPADVFDRLDEKQKQPSPKPPQASPPGATPVPAGAEP